MPKRRQPASIHHRRFGRNRDGELTYLATEKDPSTGSYMAKVTFNNAKSLFVPGEFYHVRIATPKEVSQITVPKTAVRTKDSGDFVYIVNDSGLADARSVLTGDEEDGRVVILDGLDEGISSSLTRRIRWKSA